MTKRICVTGASGRAGRVTVAELLAHGYDVVATDLVRSPHDLGTGLLLADLTDHGQAVEVLAGTDAVVHLANIPAPDIHTPATTFNANMAMNFNVFLAAAQVRIERVVWASSETTLGLPFEVPPRYAPVDEDHYPFPTTTYTLSDNTSVAIRYFPATFYLKTTTALPTGFGFTGAKLSGAAPDGTSLYGYEIKSANFSTTAAYTAAIPPAPRSRSSVHFCRST